MVHSPPALLRRKLAAAEVVFTCTQFNVPVLTEHTGPAGIRKLRRIYHGADLERFPYAPGPPLDPPLVLAVGRLVEKKGLDHRSPPAACSPTAGAVSSAGSSPAAAIAGRDLGADPRPADRPSRSCLPSTGRALAVGAPASSRCPASSPRTATDGIPNVLVEAAASGAPLVTAVGRIPELVRDGETGLVVPPRDPGALARAIERLLDSAELSARLRESARAWVETSFDLRRNAIQVAREFTRLAGVGSSPAPDDLETLEQGAS
jgi:glycosyltransferase involved in cell wall biosynthesis